MRASGTRRVVVTGMGLVTCLGSGVEHVWSRLLQGHCGIQQLQGKDYEGLSCKIAGLVPRGSGKGELDLDKEIKISEQRTMCTATCYALVAAKQALGQAKWFPESESDQNRTGVAVGMGMVGLEDIVDTGITLQNQGQRKVSPYFIPRILVNMAAGHISLRYSLKGPNHAVSTACTTGAHAIGDAARFIQHGDADVMVCGGTEASVCPIALAGFGRMRALSTKFNSCPSESSRPFDSERDGFVMSDGAGLLVLEELNHALSRGAEIYAEIRGYGLSADANHITAPAETGDGAEHCMRAALYDAGLTAADIGYINAHATSTPIGDAAESRAILCMCSHNPAVSSTKGAVGHLLGAAGSVEAIFTVLSVYHGQIPATLNCDQPDTGLSNLVRSQAQEWRSSSRTALTNSFGFGGTNASLCISNFKASVH